MPWRRTLRQFQPYIAPLLNLYYRSYSYYGTPLNTMTPSSQKQSVALLARNSKNCLIGISKIEPV